MMARYGGVVLLDGHFASDAFLARARVCPPASAFLPGAARACHDNARRFAAADAHCHHMTGLARTGTVWVCHSWIERDGQTLETTPLARDAYVGYPITTALDTRK